MSPLPVIAKLNRYITYESQNIIHLCIKVKHIIICEHFKTFGLGKLMLQHENHQFAIFQIIKVDLI